MKIDELTKQEQIEITGGDKFMHDLGRAIGRFFGSYVSNLTSLGPSAMDAAMMYN
ncbi:MAG: hypothetical protein JXR41_11075 [Bacteroidales bacterium]|nr:hypothetical protein [Bacteroidales bacterium]